MQLKVQSQVWQRFPGMRIVAAVARGVDNRHPRASVDALWRAAWYRAAEAQRHGNAQSHPRVRPWRDRFQAMGVSGKQFPTSIEALLRRALKGGEPFRVNPLVDLGNAVSLRHTVPVGAFDLGDLNAPVEVRLTRPGDRFTALDSAVSEEVPPGEVAYASGATILSRHLAWRQARTGLVRPESSEVVVVSELLGELEVDLVETVRQELEAGLLEHFEVHARAFLLDELCPVAELGAPGR